MGWFYSSLCEWQISDRRNLLFQCIHWNCVRLIVYDGWHLVCIFGLVFRQESFRKTTVFLAYFIVFFDCILNSDLPSWEILSVHLLNCQIGRSKIVETHESMTFTGPIFRVSGDFCIDDEPKVAESFIKHFLVDLRIEITYKKVGSNILSSLILRGLIDLDGFTKHFNHVHDLNWVIGIILTFELNKAITLVLIGDFISGQMNVNNRATLDKQLPEETFGDFLIEITDVNGCLLVALVKRGDLSHLVIIKFVVLKGLN